MVKYLEHPGFYFSFKQLKEIQKLYESKLNKENIIKVFKEKYPESDEIVPELISLLIDKLDSSK